jgi:hypothetical protein
MSPKETPAAEGISYYIELMKRRTWSKKSYVLKFGTIR